MNDADEINNQLLFYKFSMINEILDLIIRSELRLVTFTRIPKMTVTESLPSESM